MTTVTDVERALTQARELEDYLLTEGWESLQIEEEEEVIPEILNVYLSTIRSISPNSDPEVMIHVELPERIYVVPLEDVSVIHLNDCLVIGKEDLYPDWEDRVLSRLGKASDIVDSVQTTSCKGVWDRYTYLSPDGKTRVVWEKIK